MWSLLLLIVILHLQLGDWLPLQVRYVADVLLILLTILSLARRKRSRSNDAGAALHFVGLVYLVLNLAYCIYSFILWGELLLIIRQARQSLLAALYLVILFHPYAECSGQKHKRFFEGLLWFFTLNTVLTSLDVISPPYSERVEIFQAFLIRKHFVKGALATYLLLIVLISKFLDKRFLGGLIFGFLYIILVAIYVIRFRYWFVMVSGVFILLVTFALRNKKSVEALKSLLIALAIISILGIAFSKSTYCEYLGKWIYSAWIDFMNQQGTFGYRLERDISRIHYQLQDHLLFVLFGYGFVHKESSAAKALGFSSETNDVGFVQLMVTYGVVGGSIYLGVWLLALLFLYRSFEQSKSLPLGGATVIGLMMVLSLVSSNFLLWETFFVPSFIAMRLLLWEGNKRNQRSQQACLSLQLTPMKEVTR